MIVIVFVYFHCSVFDGFLSLEYLTKKVVSQNYQLDSPIGNAVFKKIYRLTENDVLGLVSRILEIEEFVAIVDENNRPVGVVTHIDLLSFAAKGCIVDNTKKLKV